MVKYIVTRDITTDECEWLDKTIKEGTIVNKFYGTTYGCMGPDGIAVTFDKDGGNPFFELPYNSLKKLRIR
jgi:hypothetical protein